MQSHMHVSSLLFRIKIGLTTWCHHTPVRICKKANYKTWKSDWKLWSLLVGPMVFIVDQWHVISYVPAFVVLFPTSMARVLPVTPNYWMEETWLSGVWCGAMYFCRQVVLCFCFSGSVVYQFYSLVLAMPATLCCCMKGTRLSGADWVVCGVWCGEMDKWCNFLFPRFGGVPILRPWECLPLSAAGRSRHGSVM